jgi:hypothetical protein
MWRGRRRQRPVYLFHTLLHGLLLLDTFYLCHLLLNYAEFLFGLFTLTLVLMIGLHCLNKNRHGLLYYSNQKHITYALQFVENFVDVFMTGQSDGFALSTAREHASISRIGHVDVYLHEHAPCVVRDFIELIEHVLAANVRHDRVIFHMRSGVLHNRVP